MKTEIPPGEPRTPAELREHMRSRRSSQSPASCPAGGSARALRPGLQRAVPARAAHPQLVKKTDPESFAWAIHSRVLSSSRSSGPTQPSSRWAPETARCRSPCLRACGRSMRWTLRRDHEGSRATSPTSRGGSPTGRISPSPGQHRRRVQQPGHRAHLHPEDAGDQLTVRFPARACVYVCITPNRVSGPHDILGIFDDVVTGFHLKEYTFRELRRLFEDIGFRV